MLRGEGRSLLRGEGRSLLLGKFRGSLSLAVFYAWLLCLPSPVYLLHISPYEKQRYPER